VREQRDVLLYEILPFLSEMNAEGEDILWCPSTDKVECADYRQDALEVLDVYEKIEEFNICCGPREVRQAMAASVQKGGAEGVG